MVTQPGQAIPMTATQFDHIRTCNDVRCAHPAHGFIQGRKDDSEKLRYDLIPPSTLEALATILTFGAKKYNDRNWEAGIKWGRVFGALMRHMWAWWRGEAADPESGRSHLWHAQCCLSFLIEYETTHKELDDRPVTLQQSPR